MAIIDGGNPTFIRFGGQKSFGSVGVAIAFLIL